MLACTGGAGGGFPVLITEEKELELGAGVHDSIVTEYTLSTNPTLNGYVRALGNELVAKSDRPDLLHQFFILETEEINAFAAPGGYLYVTLGLMRNLETRAQLAGVLGHEIGHVSGKHGARDMQSQVLGALFTDWLLGDNAATKELINWLVNFYRTTAHSRDFEREADTLGVNYAAAAGYNPWGLVQFFAWLDGLSTDIPLSEFLSSHPAPSERVENTTAQVQGMGIAENEPGYIVDDAAPPYMSYADFRAQLPVPVAAPVETAE